MMRCSVGIHFTTPNILLMEPLTLVSTSARRSAGLVPPGPGTVGSGASHTGNSGVRRGQGATSDDVVKCDAAAKQLIRGSLEEIDING